MFAYMLTGQGRVGLFLSFSFFLEVLDRILVLRGLGLQASSLAGQGANVVKGPAVSPIG